MYLDVFVEMSFLYYGDKDVLNVIYFIFFLGMKGKNMRNKQVFKV